MVVKHLGTSKYFRPVACRYFVRYIVLAVVVQVSSVYIANMMTRIRLLMLVLIGSDVARGITGTTPTVDIAAILSYVVMSIVVTYC